MNKTNVLDELTEKVASSRLGPYGDRIIAVERASEVAKLLRDTLQQFGSLKMPDGRSFKVVGYKAGSDGTKDRFLLHRL